MRSLERSFLPALLSCAVVGAAGLLAWGTSAAADPPPVEKTVTALASGTVGAGGRASEPVVFSGQAVITGKVIEDTVFRAPPVLEIIVDLSKVVGKGQRSGKAYVVASPAILHRPLLANDVVEVNFTFAADGNALQARSATASFGILYSAAKGVSTTPVRIATQSPG